MTPIKAAAEPSELLALADRHASARKRYHESDADLIRESEIIEWALRRASAPAGNDGVRDALANAEASFEFIRLKLVDCLNEPERSAFWKAVEARDAIRALKPQDGGNCEHGIAKVNCGICVPSKVFSGGSGR